MKTNSISFKHILAIGFILGGATVAWMILAGTLTARTGRTDSSNAKSVAELWGPAQGQAHPSVWYLSPTGKSGRKYIQPTASDIAIKLDFDPKKKGLAWNRTYNADFTAIYTIPNPTPIEQTVYISFPLPSENSSFNDFEFTLGEKKSQQQTPRGGVIEEATTIPAGAEVQLKIAYQSRGIDRWVYRLGEIDRISNFHLEMDTSFADIDFPDGASSPTDRGPGETADSWKLEWNYPDVIHPQDVGMDMPKVLNPGPVAARMSFFAPVSLLFFFAVLLILGAVKGIHLHPMNYFFLAAGFFAFQILFAYLVDLLSLHISFVIASVVSLVLVGSYVRAAAGSSMLKIALPAQFAYLVLFSYSFFFDGLSGLTITIGAIATLALLMIYTAKIDWADIFATKPRRRAVTPPAPPVQ
ncbi:inner membrane CreD family protein [Verrucomicrobiaceae bacterium 5K15]|uniref:Inner membrane CreD family protein n=1 Tax=Oceaniferula flava TaxID=2800421 RepID=A0AAE2SCM2_9BACT|nr:inner membrane CreD family protein [Oceaniferula flavus]MBK1854552.1 inner membrane CreD family protein [Oceaniferula flavus]MBM1135858.1 inner membrane CreD family protein [Oceaniferula flavus]